MSEEMEALQRIRSSKMTDVIEVGGFIIPKIMSESLAEIKTFETREDDVFIVTYPKSGTTWLQEIVYVIRNDCDFEAAKRESLDTRVPFLEFPLPGMPAIKNMKSPRSLKTHYPMSLLPENLENKCKV
jgi:hypothetical protein